MDILTKLVFETIYPPLNGETQGLGGQTDGTSVVSKVKVSGWEFLYSLATIGLGFT